MTVLGVVFEVASRHKLYILVAIALIYVAKLYRDSSRLNAFRGPFLARFSDLWFAKAVFGDSQHAVAARVSKKYGSIARIGPNLLLTSSPELWMRINAARSPYTRADWYAALRFPHGEDNIVSQQDEENHAKRRAQMADGYAGKTNPTLEPTISKHVQNFLDLIRREYISSKETFKPIDMARKASYFTMDVITDIAFGQPFGNLPNDRDTFDYIQNTEEMLPVIQRLTAFPLVRALFLSSFGALFSPKITDKKGAGKLMGYATFMAQTGIFDNHFCRIAQQLVSKRFAAKDTDIRQDMLASFISRGLDEHDAVIESIVQILAGADTTATAIRCIILHTITNPHVYRTLQKEIDTALQDGRVSTEGIMSNFEAKELPYLQAVIKEGLRIWPPVTGLLSKKSPPEGDIFYDSTGNKISIPGNVDIGWSSWAMQRSKEIFGADAEMFRPERWLQSEETTDKDMLAMMGKLSELIFGFGKWQCLGRNVATMELNKLVFELFRHFDFSVVYPAKPWRSVDTGLWLQSELWVRVTDRAESK